MQLQKKSHVFYRHINDLLTYPLIIISVVCSIIVGSTDRSSLAIRIVIISLNLVITLLTAILRQMEPSEKVQAHHDSAVQFTTLVNTIDSCLKIPSEMRSDVQIFLDAARQDMNRLIMTQQEPPSIVEKLYERRNGSIDVLLYGQDINDLYANRIQTNMTADV